jgi:hypothetical protein
MPDLTQPQQALFDIYQWTGSASSRVDIEIAARNAEALVARCRSRYIAPVPRTAAGQQPASEQQVRAALRDGGIIESRIDDYITSWNRLKLQGVAGPAALQVRPPTIAQQRASLNAQRAEQGLPPLSVSQFRTINQAPILPSPAPAPAPAPAPVPQDSIFGELPTVSTDVEYPPFGGGRQ